MLRNEGGVTTVVVVGVMLLITIFAIGGFWLAQANLHGSVRSKNSNRALHVADSGVERALWYLRVMGATGTLPTTFTVTVEGQGTATVTASSAGEYGSYEIVSVGSVVTSLGETFKRAIKVKAYSINIWNMMFSGFSQSIPAGGSGINGTTSVDGAFYVRGDVPLSGGSSLNTGPIFIKQGRITFQGSADVGNETSPTVLAEDGVWDLRGQPDEITADEIPYVKGGVTFNAKELRYDPPDISLPELEELDTYRQLAHNESFNDGVGCEMESTPGVQGYPDGDEAEYKVIDSNSSTNGDTDLTIDENMASFGLVYRDASTTPVQKEFREFAWDRGEGRLYINGTVFVDGDLHLNGTHLNTHNLLNNQVYTQGVILYSGNGTLVVNGDVYLDSPLLPVPYNYDPSAGNYDTELTTSTVIGVVTNGNIYITFGGRNANPSKDKPYFSGAFFSSSRISFQRNNVSFVGSCVGGLLDFGTASNIHLFTHSGLPNFLPPSLPGRDENIVTLTGWHEIPPP